MIGSANRSTNSPMMTNVPANGFISASFHQISVNVMGETELVLIDLTVSCLRVACLLGKMAIFVWVDHPIHNPVKVLILLLAGQILG